MTDLTGQNTEFRSNLKDCKRWVVKIGSSLLTDNGVKLDDVAIAQWVSQLAWLRQQNVQLILVSSGAVAAGMSRLGMPARPAAVHELQAAAAVGQMGLIQTYEAAFQTHNLQTAQVLLTHDDLSDRKRYLNARSALFALLELGVVPVVNENDTVVTDEIRFGDNDTLAALVANLVEASALIILTDQKGLFHTDPRKDPNAKLVEVCSASDSDLMTMATPGGSGLGRGGMVTKVRAAQLAGRSGASTVIAGGREPQIIQRIYHGENCGTLLVPEQDQLNARKQWLAGHLQMKGQLVLDDGAVQVLRVRGSSLLAVGVVSSDGVYRRGEMVSCVDSAGDQVLCGLINYNSDEVALIKGKSSSEIEVALGYVDEDELIHRDNMVVF